MRIVTPSEYAKHILDYMRSGCPAYIEIDLDSYVDRWGEEVFIITESRSVGNPKYRYEQSVTFSLMPQGCTFRGDRNMEKLFCEANKEIGQNYRIGRIPRQAIDGRRTIPTARRIRAMDIEGNYIALRDNVVNRTIQIINAKSLGSHKLQLRISPDYYLIYDIANNRGRNGITAYDYITVSDYLGTRNIRYGVSSTDTRVRILELYESNITLGISSIAQDNNLTYSYLLSLLEFDFPEKELKRRKIRAW